MHKILLALLAASAVTGQFQAEKKPPIKPTYAAAYETRDPRDARKRAIEVVLSEKPIDVAAAVEELDPHTHVINQEALKDTNYVLLWVRPDGDVSMNATYSNSMAQYVDTKAFGKMKIELTKNTPDEVAGRVATTRAEYSGDFTFAAKVTRRAAGTKLAAGGGDAGKAFLALVAAAGKKNWPAIQKLVTEETRFDGVDDAVEMLGFWIPKKKVKVTSGEQRGDEVILEVEGEMFEGQQGLYLVRMLRTGSDWKFDRATKAGLID
jgi:hypothetical protein